MPETVTLPVPVPKPSRTAVSLDRLTIDVRNKSILVQWIGDDGEPGSAAYPTPAPAGSSQPTGAALLTALNTANLTSNSLVKRVFTRLIADGYLSGSVAGSPD